MKKHLHWMIYQTIKGCLLLCFVVGVFAATGYIDSLF